MVVRFGLGYGWPNSAIFQEVSIFFACLQDVSQRTAGFGWDTV